MTTLRTSCDAFRAPPVQHTAITVAIASAFQATCAGNTLRGVMSAGIYRRVKTNFCLPQQEVVKFA